jgi:hypothetical protein
MSSDALPSMTIHRIDAHNRICFVDEGFRRAAIAAGVEPLADRVVGTPLFSHFSGEPTKQWYRYLIDHVRRRGNATFEFNCDTPTVVRLQRMDMVRLPDESIEFITRTLSTRPRPYAQLLNWPLPRSRKRILMCSWCLRISSVVGWTDVERAAQVMQVFEEPVPPSIDYTICDEDLARLTKILEERPE